MSETESRNIVVEHPLETKWTCWCDRTVRGATAEQFKESLKLIHSIETVEEFWQVIQHIPTVDSLAPGVTYHLMRDNREPMWEDAANRNGGTWRFRVSKQDSPRVWMEVISAAIGEQFIGVITQPDRIVGVSLSSRERDDLLQIWNSDSQLADLSTESLYKKLDDLLADKPVTFLASFYKPNQTHQAYEGARTMQPTNPPFP